MARRCVRHFPEDLEMEAIDDTLADVARGNFKEAAFKFCILQEIWPRVYYILNNLICEFRKMCHPFPRPFMFQKIILASAGVCPRLGKNSFKHRILRRITKDPVIFYNIALILFHNQLYHRALDLMVNYRDRFLKYEPLMNRGLFMHIALLLKTQDYSKALILIEEQEAQIKVKKPVQKGHGDSGDHDVKKIQIQQYKTQCFLSTGALGKAKRECKILFSLTGTNHPNSHVGACLKANHDYLRGNYKKASKTMLSYYEETMGNSKTEIVFDKSNKYLAVIFKNNEACCELKQERPTAATFYFTRAMEEYDKLKVDSIASPAMNDKLRFNFGIALLHKDPIKAFPYLLASANRYYDNPRIWLRVAEACIGIYQKDPLKFHNNWSPQKDEFYCEFKVGLGSNRKLMFPKFETEKPKFDAAEMEGIPLPTLEYALQCLENSLGLLRKGIKAGYVSCKPSNPIMDRGEITCLHVSILCASAYVALELEDYSLAIKRCKEILALDQKWVPSGHVYLANLYLGTAYSEVGETNLAIDVLLSEVKYDLLFRAVLNVEGRKDEHESTWTASTNSALRSFVYRPNEWFPNNRRAAEACYKYNQMVAIAKVKPIEGLKLLMDWNYKPDDNYYMYAVTVPLEILYLYVYVYMRLGHSKIAYGLLWNNRLIRKNPQHRFVSFTR